MLNIVGQLERYYFRSFNKNVFYFSFLNLHLVNLNANENMFEYSYSKYLIVVKTLEENCVFVFCNRIEFVGINFERKVIILTISFLRLCFARLFEFNKNRARCL